MAIKLKRAYQQPATGDGARLLIDRLWPRGVRKDALRLDDWPKDVAPSDALRKWFAHDPARWDEFRRRYFAELDARPEAVAESLRRVRGGTVTLVYAAHDSDRNNAVAVKEYLAARGSAHAHGGGD